MLWAVLEATTERRVACCRNTRSDEGEMRDDGEAPKNGRRCLRQRVRWRVSEVAVSSLASLHVEVGDNWISITSTWLSPTCKPRFLELRDQEGATRMLAARV